MPSYKIDSFRGALSDYEDKGVAGAFKFGTNLDVRKKKDTLSAGQALADIGNLFSNSASTSPSVSVSPSSSLSESFSPSVSPSISVSPSLSSASPSRSPSASVSPSASTSASPSSSKSPSLSPSISPSAGQTSVFEDLILHYVKCSDGFVYGFGSTGRVYKISSDFYVQQVYNAGQRIRGAEELPSSNGTSSLVFATNTKVHIKPLPGLSNWNDVNSVAGYPKANLTFADWHTMKQIGGAVYIGNKSSLAMIGYDGSYTNNALDLIPGNIVKTIVERNGRAIMGTVKAADPNQGINAAIDCEVPLAQVGSDGELYYANMNDSIPFKRFPGGGIVNPGGVTNQVSQVTFFEWEQTALSWIDKQDVGNMSLWGVYNADSGKGGVYSVGRKFKDHPFVMNLEYALDVDEIGAVTNFNGTTMISYRDDTDYGVKIVDSSRKATGTYEGLDLKAPIKTPANITTWKYAELFMAPLPSGSSVEFWYRMNKNGDFIRAYTVDGQNSYSYATGKKAVFRIAEEGEIFEPRVVLNPHANSSPEVYRMLIYFA